MFGNIKKIHQLEREKEHLNAEIRRLKHLINKQDKELAQKQIDIDNLHSDFMRLMRDSTIQVSVDETGRIRELVKSTPHGFIIEKREKEKNE